MADPELDLDLDKAIADLRAGGLPDPEGTAKKVLGCVTGVHFGRVFWLGVEILEAISMSGLVIPRLDVKQFRQILAVHATARTMTGKQAQEIEDMHEKYKVETLTWSARGGSTKKES